MADEVNSYLDTLILLNNDGLYEIYFTKPIELSRFLHRGESKVHLPNNLKGAIIDDELSRRGFNAVANFYKKLGEIIRGKKAPEIEELEAA